MGDFPRGPAALQGTETIRSLIQYTATRLPEKRSVLRTSIPLRASLAGALGLCETPYTGSRSVGSGQQSLDGNAMVPHAGSPADTTGCPSPFASALSLRPQEGLSVATRSSPEAAK